MKKRELLWEYIFLIEDFLSPEECRQFIEAGERIGFTDAPITTHSGPEMRPDIRNNTRVMYEDGDLATRLYERAQPFLVETWRSRTLCGMNERLRYYRYEPGQRFAPHYDGRFDRGNGERSEFSFLIYLNEGFEGGQTRFFEPERISIEPRAGSVLVFQHRQLHEGAVLESGVKYVLRSDVMYRAQDQESVTTAQE